MTITYTRVGHNEAKTIRQCVRSHEVDDIIGVDNGSTDDMWREVQRIKEQDTYIPAYHRWKLPRPRGLDW